MNLKGPQLESRITQPILSSCLQVYNNTTDLEHACGLIEHEKNIVRKSGGGNGVLEAASRLGRKMNPPIVLAFNDKNLAIYSTAREAEHSSEEESES